MENNIILGERYAVTNGIYPPKYSVIKLIGKTGYSFVENFSRKWMAESHIVNNGGILEKYEHDRDKIK